VKVVKEEISTVVEEVKEEIFTAVGVKGETSMEEKVMAKTTMTIMKSNSKSLSR
jgi:uncharacterized protein GlcG (DUF336 family)